MKLKKIAYLVFLLPSVSIILFALGISIGTILHWLETKEIM